MIILIGVRGVVVIIITIGLIELLLLILHQCFVNGLIIDFSIVKNKLL